MQYYFSSRYTTQWPELLLRTTSPLSLFPTLPSHLDSPSVVESRRVARRLKYNGWDHWVWPCPGNDESHFIECLLCVRHYFNASFMTVLCSGTYYNMVMYMCPHYIWGNRAFSCDLVRDCYWVNLISCVLIMHKEGITINW